MKDLLAPDETRDAVLLVGGALALALSAVKDASLGDQPKKFANTLRSK